MKALSFKITILAATLFSMIQCNEAEFGGKNAGPRQGNTTSSDLFPPGTDGFMGGETDGLGNGDGFGNAIGGDNGGTNSGLNGDGTTAGNNDKKDEGVFSDSLKSCSDAKNGFGALLYQLTPNIQNMPMLKSLTPIGQLTTQAINIPERDWETGFPSRADLKEWFGIRFFGAINVTTAGSYTFKTSSDDGVRLFIDDRAIINSPGIQSFQDRLSSPVQLSAGKHKFALEWWQGPKVRLGLQLFWNRNGTGFTQIPSYLVEYEQPCNIQNLGTLPL